MTDLEIIKKAIDPLIRRLPDFPFVDERKMIEKMLTHEAIKELYKEAGGKKGVYALASAIIRIGKGDSLGQP